jgi:hypothetical protein
VGITEVSTPEGHFDGFPQGLDIYRAVAHEISVLGVTSVRVTKSQIAFRRRKGFAYLWRPGRYIASNVPAVLSIALPHEVTSDRFKEVAHPTSNVWMHHLELRDVPEVDDEVRQWLAEAYASAG